MNITWKGSPNKDANRKPIDRIVIHWFGIGTLESANARFQNASSKVSAHYGISNKTIYQWVKEDEVAYHAGNYAMNQRSIGIEHDATSQDDASPHNASEDTYKTSAELVKDICNRHSIPIDREHIIGHKEVSATQCPGTLDIDRIIAMAKESDEACVKLSEDVPSFVEDKYDLKSKDWYNKYWNLDEFIRDSIATHDELDVIKEKFSDLTKKHELSETIIENGTKEIQNKNLQIETLQSSNAENTAQLSVMGEQVKEANRQKALAETAKLEAETKLKTVIVERDNAQIEVKKLNIQLTGNLQGYSKWTRFKSLFDFY